MSRCSMRRHRPRERGPIRTIHNGLKVVSGILSPSRPARGQVEAKLTIDGGLQSVSPVRFAHPACGYFKIDVEFEFKRNAADQNRAIADKADKVTKVSKPYIERPFAD